MYPTDNKVPYTVNLINNQVVHRDITIEELREKGDIVVISDDGLRATVKFTHGLTVAYCGVTLDKDGKIEDYIKREGISGSSKFIGKFSKITPVIEEKHE